MESSLKNFKTDYLDILMIHGITIDDNIAEIEKVLPVQLSDIGALKRFRKISG